MKKICFDVEGLRVDSVDDVFGIVAPWNNINFPKTKDIECFFEGGKICFTIQDEAVANELENYLIMNKRKTTVGIYDNSGSSICAEIDIGVRDVFIIHINREGLIVSGDVVI